MTRKRTAGRLGTAVAVAAGAVIGYGGAFGASLPGGASSLNETYQDWIVACQARDDAARCVMTQIRTAPRTGQRVLAIELRAAGEETVAGVLVMPFGLALSKGVALRVDDGAGEPASDFSTCLPGGCLVPLAFDAAMIAELQSGSVLNVTATANETGQPVSFALSLNGFSAALTRMAELAE